MICGNGNGAFGTNHSSVQAITTKKQWMKHEEKGLFTWECSAK